MTTKQNVHNLFEAKVLLKEFDDRGDFFEMDILFLTHDGKKIGTAKWNDSEFKHDNIVRKE